MLCPRLVGVMHAWSIVVYKSTARPRGHGFNLWSDYRVAAVGKLLTLNNARAGGRSRESTKGATIGFCSLA
jgi:hypothetical protein